MIDNKKLNGQVVSGVSWKLAERIMNQGISFIVTIILARLLTPNDYGAVAMVNVFVAIADIIISSGFTSALIQKKTVSESDYSTIFYLNLMISVGLYSLLFVLAPTISNLYKMDNLTMVLRVIALKLPLSALYTVQSAHVSRNMNFKIFFFSTMIGTLISAVVGIVMAKSGYGVWSLVAQQLVCLLVGTLIMCFTVKWRPKFVFSKKVIKETRGFGVRVMLTDVIGTIFNQLNAFIIGLFYTTEDLAYYSKGQNIPNMATNIAATSFVSVLFPAMSTLSDEKKKLKELLRSSTKMFAFIVFPILFGTFIVATDLIEVLYTSKWSGITIFLQIMCISGLISMLGEFDILTLKALGKSKIILILEVIKKPFFLIVTFIAIQFDVVWIAISMILINLFALFINTFALKKEIGYGVVDKFLDCLNSILLSIFMVLTVFLVGFVPIKSVMLRLIVKILAGMIAYFGLAMITKNKEFITMVNFIKTKIIKNKYQPDDNSITSNSDEKCLFICNTVYQVIVSTSIASQFNCNCDIIISDHTNSMIKVVEKIKTEKKYFNKCNFIETKEFCFGQGDKTLIKEGLKNKLSDCGYLSHYERIFVANWEPFTHFVYAELKKINKNIKLSWFEDGLGTYSFDGKFFNKPNIITSIKNKLKNRYSLYNEVKSLYLYKPSFLCWRLDKSIDIFDIKVPNNDCIIYLNKIFDYENLKDKYDKKVIFFQDGYMDFDLQYDIDALEVIAKEIGKENILVKRHPRDTTNKFENNKFITNKDTTIPAELIILNNDFKDTIFATFYSQSVVTAATLFEKNIKSIILAKLDLTENKENLYFEFLNDKFYKDNPEIYIVPNTMEDMKKALKEILNKK